MKGEKRYALIEARNALEKVMELDAIFLMDYPKVRRMISTLTETIQCIK